MNIDEENLKKCIEGFERVENISDIIILGDNGGIRRIIFQEQGVIDGKR